MSTTTNPAVSVTSAAITKRYSRRDFTRLTSNQRRALRSEYRYLREAYQMPPFAAAGTIRRMASMATWR